MASFFFLLLSFKALVPKVLNTYLMSIQEIFQYHFSAQGLIKGAVGKK